MATLEFFRNIKSENNFFDEGPIVHVRQTSATVNTSSIDTSTIDGFRQGVEITLVKHFDAGIVKIHAGEPGHILKRTSYGANTANYKDDPLAFVDDDYFSAEDYLKSVHTPISTIASPNVDESVNFVFDGIIEPLIIRVKSSFLSASTPTEPHGVYGSVMMGNEDIKRSSDKLVTIYEINANKIVPFVDLTMGQFNSGSRATLNRYFLKNKTNATPFVDARYVRDVIPSASYSSTMTAALSLMSGSTGNFIPTGYRSATAGKEYENNFSVGTDSIVYGGLTY